MAWAILPASEKGSWKWVWLNLLGQLEGFVPPRCWCSAIEAFTPAGCTARSCGCTGIMQGYYRLKGKLGYLPLRGLIAEGSRSWQEEEFCFMGKATLRCTLLVR